MRPDIKIIKSIWNLKQLNESRRNEGEKNAVKFDLLPSASGVFVGSTRLLGPHTRNYSHWKGCGVEKTVRRISVRCLTKSERAYLHVCMYFTARKCVFLLFKASVDGLPNGGVRGRHTAGGNDSSMAPVLRLVTLRTHYNAKNEKSNCGT